MIIFILKLFRKIINCSKFVLWQTRSLISYLASLCTVVFLLIFLGKMFFQYPVTMLRICISKMYYVTFYLRSSVSEFFWWHQIIEFLLSSFLFTPLTDYLSARSLTLLREGPELRPSRFQRQSCLLVDPDLILTAFHKSCSFLELSLSFITQRQRQHLPSWLTVDSAMQVQCLARYLSQSIKKVGTRL